MALFEAKMKDHGEEGFGAFLLVMTSHPSHNLTPWQGSQDPLWPIPQWSQVRVYWSLE